MGWVHANLAAEEQLIVAHEQDPRLAYAVSAVPSLAVLTDSIDFALSAQGAMDRVTRGDASS